MNKDLLKIRNWCFDNQLLLNPDKTKLIIFGSRQMATKVEDFRLSLLGKELVPVKVVKDLGIILDSNIYIQRAHNYHRLCMYETPWPDQPGETCL